jgi:hypothetical protein
MMQNRVEEATFIKIKRIVFGFSIIKFTDMIVDDSNVRIAVSITTVGKFPLNISGI